MKTQTKTTTTRIEVRITMDVIAFKVSSIFFNEMFLGSRPRILLNGRLLDEGIAFLEVVDSDDASVCSIEEGLSSVIRVNSYSYAKM